MSQRLASDAGQFRRKVVRLLHAVDLVTGRASVLGHQQLSVRDLLWRRGIEMNVGQKIGVRLISKERSQERNLRIVETVMPFPDRRRVDCAAKPAAIPV